MDDEDLRFLVVLGCEFFLLCLFDGLSARNNSNSGWWGNVSL